MKTGDEKHRVKVFGELYARSNPLLTSSCLSAVFDGVTCVNLLDLFLS